MFFKSLYIKINLTILFVFIAVLAYFTFNMQKSLEQDAMNFTKSQAKYITEMLKRNIAIDMLGFCERGVQKVVERTAEIQGVEIIRVFDAVNLIKYSNKPKEIGLSLKSLDKQADDIANMGGEERHAPYEGEGKEFTSFCIIEDIENSQRCQSCHGAADEVIATINVCMSMEIAEKELAKNQRLSINNAIVSIILVTIVLSVLLALFVNKPIKKLVKTMTAAEKGNLNVRVDINTSDELGLLGDKFNTMLMKLEKANKDIEKYHQEQLLRVDRLATVGEMAAGIAHEIKNPLAGLAGATQILAKDFPENDHRKEITEEMLKLINRLDKIIKDLLTFSRKTTPHLVVSSINEAVEKVLFFVSPQAKKRNINIDKKFDEDVSRVLMDPEHIQQVFLNMVLNAIQSMKDGGRLEISTSMETIKEGSEDILEPGIYAVTSFKDNGAGIPPDILSTIFKPFFTTKNQGTGLGLSISQKIIEEHKGKILVASKEGEGTTFKVYLPKRYQ